MSPRLVRSAAALLLFADGLLHFALVSTYLQEDRLVGSLFIPAAAALVGVAVWLSVRDDLTGWAVGGIVAALMLLARVAGPHHD